MKVDNLTCPRCQSRNVDCSEKPHRHRCLDCGYDGTRPNASGGAASDGERHDG